jgi:hypothetical protein
LSVYLAQEPLFIYFMHNLQENYLVAGDHKAQRVEALYTFLRAQPPFWGRFFQTWQVHFRG